MEKPLDKDNDAKNVKSSPITSNPTAEPYKVAVASDKFPDCVTCQHIWDRLFCPLPNRHDLLLDLGTIDTALGTDCSRHRVFIEAALDYHRGERWNSAQDLFAIKSSYRDGYFAAEIYPADHKSWAKSVQYCLVKKSGVPDHPGWTISPKPDWIDLDLARSWVDTCISGHENCRVPLAPWQANIRPMWLIDAEKHCLVPGDTGEDYIALSYRWGDSKGLQFTEGTLQQLRKSGALGPHAFGSQLSPLILDAIGLTTLLGMRYIWIDNLCISTFDTGCEEELGKMGAIYANAAFTIAVMDENGPAGLVGVALRKLSSARVIPPRDYIPFGGEAFSLDLYRWDSIVGSRNGNDERLAYNRRGCTYQEFQMSRRLLIIEQHRIYWRCHDSCSPEFGIPMTSNYERRSSSLSQMLRRGACMQQLNKVINDYNIREHTYEEDALPGISGLLTTLSQKFEGGFLCGIPEAYFEAGLCWHREDIGLSRRVYSSRPLSKRLDSSYLPSWSWIGWRGEINLGEEAREVEYPLFTSTELLYDTYPITNWYSGESRLLEARKVQNIWLEGRDGYNDLTRPLPEGWTRHNASDLIERWARDDVRDLLEYPLRPPRFDPDDSEFAILNIRKYWYNNRSGALWHWPFPAEGRGEWSAPPVTPEQLPHICCETDQVFLRASKYDPRPRFSRERRYYELQLLNQEQQVVGFLCPDKEAAGPRFPPGDSGVVTDMVELVAICRRTRHERRGSADFKTSEIYAVLWVERIEKVAYRLGYGEVDKEAWESLPRERIELIMG